MAERRIVDIGPLLEDLKKELKDLVMVSNCLEREFIHRQLATGRPLHMNV